MEVEGIRSPEAGMGRKNGVQGTAEEAVLYKETWGSSLQNSTQVSSDKGDNARVRSKPELELGKGYSPVLF